MSNFDFDAMDNKKKRMYQALWGSERFDFPVEKTKGRNGESNNSYSFTQSSSADFVVCCKRLADVFEIENKALFAEKMWQSCSGSGQELRRISTIHSSSLCALLFFYHVSIFHPLILDVDGEECRFEYSCFEYQNEVIAGRNPSNIDVVLVGKNVNTGKAVVLFLESKFSEYYERPGKQLGIAKEYLGENYAEWIYKSDLLNRLQIMTMTDKVDDEKEFLIKSSENCYLEGIKQMISHYIGVCNRCSALKSTSDAVSEAIKRGAIVYLGEIIFDRGVGDLEIAEGRKCFDSYEEKYRGLVKILNEHLKSEGKSEQIVVLNELYRYSLFENNGFEIEPLIRRFYFELGKEDV